MSARRRGSGALRPALVWLACAGWLCSGAYGYAQLRLGTLTGTVHDASGAATIEIGRHLQLDVAHWGRQFDDTADPNVFFNTTKSSPTRSPRARRAGRTCA